MPQECVRTLCVLSLGVRVGTPAFNWWSVKQLQNTFKSKLIGMGRCWAQPGSVLCCLVSFFPLLSGSWKNTSFSIGVKGDEA